MNARVWGLLLVMSAVLAACMESNPQPMPGHHDASGWPPMDTVSAADGSGVPEVLWEKDGIAPCDVMAQEDTVEADIPASEDVVEACPPTHPWLGVPPDLVDLSCDLPQGAVCSWPAPGCAPDEGMVNSCVCEWDVVSQGTAWHCLRPYLECGQVLSAAEEPDHKQ